VRQCDWHSLFEKVQPGILLPNFTLRIVAIGSIRGPQSAAVGALRSASAADDATNSLTDAGHFSIIVIQLKRRFFLTARAIHWL
jgi:hypothetical protein